MVRLLIKADKDLPEARNLSNGRVPLHEATENNNLEAIKILLEEAHVTPRPCSLANEIPINLAEQLNHTKVLTYLNNFTLTSTTARKSDWFHGEMSRDLAVIVLKDFALEYAATHPEEPDCSGAFLVRFSRKINKYALDLRIGDIHSHFEIDEKVIIRTKLFKLI
jgi:tyrosine-protein kinase shark